ncbi:MAG TPA: response regulator [Candidatus Binatia bacterium]|nr:response regulator [Candidatus Binatia bacterium]
MSDKIRVLIVDDLPETRENVRKLLQFESDVEVIAQAGNGEQAVELARQHRPDIILMDINMPGLDGIGASQAIVQHVPSAQVIIMSVQSEADYLRRAMLAGARDFLMKPFSGDELITAIRRVHTMRPALREVVTPAAPVERVEHSGRTARPRQANIVSIYSPKGGSGCTTIAVNLSVALAEQGYRTLLIDGSFQFGDVAIMLDLKPSTSIVDLMDRMVELDADLVSSVLVKHETGLRVLMAPPRPEMADLVSEEKMKSLLDMLRDQFEYIIIDSSSSLNDVALAMLDLSDRIFLVTQQSLPTLKNVSRFFDLAQTLDYERNKVLLIVNRASDKLGISVKDIGDTLKRPVIATIPADEDAVTRAADQGRPLVTSNARKRPIGQSLTRLAELTVTEFDPQKEIEDDAKKAAKVPLLRRLFGFGRRSEAVGS